ncbi:hypothetical protein [Xenorhabdus szentirmaii]|uniref:Dihydrofolate reductase n=1 Tax=Xenorhabdus szentirmaii DSM 16338 TaxID=1427518 RepID=W1J6E4_9GAMM|nr:MULTISPECIES: hypothetical protein [Xenorhabdus]PHM34615.1 dihydrofolate reductase [Xenorhabdus szentirmaii DSM 16338]PHM43345.1 dihydrofolate reductase [Xenorhabdus szentirmaii]CDL85040.1 hypothetical protein XSR1_60085 [Xenorhabdus szentirmaii DSM 16338]
MSKLVYYVAATIDGYIATADHATPNKQRVLRSGAMETVMDIQL